MLLLFATVIRAQPVAEWTAAGSDRLGSPGLFIVVDSLGQQLTTPGGLQTIGLVRDAGLLEAEGEVASAWGRLAQSLGIDSSAAIDRLFGERVVVAFSGVGLPMPRDWVLATVVSVDDVPRVLKGLGAVQRELIAGWPVFLFERESYRLCVLKRERDERVMVLAPTGPGELFERAVRGLGSAEGRAWLASDWPIAAGGGALMRVRSNRGVTLCHASAGVDGWAGQVVAPAALPADTPTWSAQDAERLIGGSALGMVGSVNAAGLGGSPLAPFIGLNQAAAESVLGQTSRRGLMCVKADADGRAEVVLATETEAGRSAEIDALMRMLIAVVTGEAETAPAFGGRLPGAVRTVPLGGGFSERIGPLVLGARPRLAWRIEENPAGGGLLAVSLGSGSALGGLAGPIEGLAEAGPGGLVSAGRFEPMPIGGLIERAAGLERPVLGWTERVESVSWQTRRLDESRVKATFEIRLRGGD